MANVVEISGERYTGNFRGALLHGQESRGSCETSHYADIRYFEGTGLIEDPQRGRLIFSFCSFNFDDYRYEGRSWDDLVEEVIIGFPKNPSLRNSPSSYGRDEYILLDGAYPRIVDLSLQNLAEQAASSTEDIPYVRSRRLDRESLVKAGLLVGKGGLMYFQDLISASSI